MVSLCGGVICVWKGKWNEVFPHARFLDPFASSAIWSEQRVPPSHLKVSLKNSVSSTLNEAIEFVTYLNFRVHLAKLVSVSNYDGLLNLSKILGVLKLLNRIETNKFQLWVGSVKQFPHLMCAAVPQGWFWSITAPEYSLIIL